MKLYKISYVANCEEYTFAWYSLNNLEQAQEDLEEAQEINETAKIETVEIPDGEEGLVKWLNINFSTDGN